MVRLDISSVTPVDQAIGCEIFIYVVLYLGVGVLAKKNRLVMNWYSFLEHEYGFLVVL